MNQDNTTVAPTEQKDGKYWLKFGLAWVISLLILFVFFYIISKAWKKGQAA